MIEKELGELPTGFALALAKDEKALMRFAEMTDQQREDILAGVNTVSSKREMAEYVNKIKTL